MEAFSNRFAIDFYSAYILKPYCLEKKICMEFLVKGHTSFASKVDWLGFQWIIG